MAEREYVETGERSRVMDINHENRKSGSVRKGVRKEKRKAGKVFRRKFGGGFVAKFKKCTTREVKMRKRKFLIKVPRSFKWSASQNKMSCSVKTKITDR